MGRLTESELTAHLINPRWVDIPEEAIFRQLVSAGINSWGDRTLYVGGFPRHYLFGGDYAYPYSLPPEVIDRLAERLNKVIHMTWYRNYNTQAIAYFEKNGEALNQAYAYWSKVGNKTLPKPEILPVDGLEDGDEYIAIIGLFHLSGGENNNNHHLYIDLIGENGARIYNHTPPLFLRYEWEGISPGEIKTVSPVRIDKPPNEPEGNIEIQWGQVLYGFYINNLAADRFRGVHIRYENDGEGNDRGHHSHYVVLQKRVYWADNPEPPPPPPPPDQTRLRGGVQVTVNQAWIAGLRPDNAGNVTFQVDIKE